MGEEDEGFNNAQNKHLEKNIEKIIIRTIFAKFLEWQQILANNALFLFKFNLKFPKKYYLSFYG